MADYRPTGNSDEIASRLFSKSYKDLESADQKKVDDIETAKKKFDKLMSTLNTLDNNAVDSFLEEIQEFCDEQEEKCVDGSLKKWYDLTDTQRSEALSRWACSRILEISEADEDDAVEIGGKSDYELDIFHIKNTGEQSKQYIAWAQVKFGRDLDYVIDRKEMLDITQSIDRLEIPPVNANETFKQKAADFKKAGGRDAEATKYILVIVAGKLNTDAQDEWDIFKQRVKTMGCKGGEIILELYDRTRILQNIIDPVTPTFKIEFDECVLPRKDRKTSKESVIGFVKAEEIKKHTVNNKDTIFSLNPRQQLGSKSITYQPILDTLASPDAKRFWKLSNGITAVCDSFKLIPNSLPITYEVENLKIVNGRQTTYALEKATCSISDVEVSISIHQIGTDREEGRLISRTTNTQNKVHEIDLISTWDEPRAFAQECENKFKMFYYERQTAGFDQAKKKVQQRVTPRRKLGKEITARTCYAYEVDPVGAMMLVTKLFNPADQREYAKVFRKPWVTGGKIDKDKLPTKIGEPKEIRDLLIPHIFREMIIGLEKKWIKEIKTEEKRQTQIKSVGGTVSKKEERDLKDKIRNKAIIHKDIVRYFLIHFIKLSMEEILDQNIRNKIENKIIEEFSILAKNTSLSSLNGFMEIADATYFEFMRCYVQNKKESYPPHILNSSDPDMKPSDDDIMKTLKSGVGNSKKSLLADLVQSKELEYNSGDKIKERLEALISPP